MNKSTGTTSWEHPLDADFRHEVEHKRNKLIKASANAERSILEGGELMPLIELEHHDEVDVKNFASSSTFSKDSRYSPFESHHPLTQQTQTEGNVEDSDPPRGVLNGYKEADMQICSPLLAHMR